MRKSCSTQALVENYYSIEMFWYPLNKARIEDFDPRAWDPYADRLMVFKTQRAAAAPGGPAPVQYSSKPNLASNLETFLGATINNVGIHTGNLAIQARAPPRVWCNDPAGTLIEVATNGKPYELCNAIDLARLRACRLAPNMQHQGMA